MYKVGLYRTSLMLFFLGLLISSGFSQTTADSNYMDDRPKLVVGVVVDQMRYDYLTRFWNQYSDGGFRRLVSEGFNCRNNHFNYAPTSTGPGHASVYTGTTPAMHGIIGNNWYDKVSDTEVYCASDPDQTTVGSDSDAGHMSPHRLLVTTLPDQLKLYFQKRSKVISVAIKDRGAVLPGGHMADAAYWFEGQQEGNWISSSYYMDQLPDWVLQFNASKAAENYRKPWNTLKNISTYIESGPDASEFESAFAGEASPVFPHNLPELWSQNDAFEILRVTPYGNSLTLDFALEALEHEDLGKDEVTDFLAISFSSTDYVGHKFGVDSKEVEDTYVRLDQDMERLLKQLDRKVGKGEYTLFLTADHGAVPVPAYLEDAHIPAGYLDVQGLREGFTQFLEFTYGTREIVKNISNYQVFLDQNIIRNLGLSPAQVQEDMASHLLTYPRIQRVYTASQMLAGNYSEGIPHILQNGFNQKRSGDILMVTDPAIAEYSRTGSTHGTPYIYDTHVPLLFFGKGISPGSTLEKTVIPDIAPTISALLGIAFPNGTTGRPISEVLTD